MTCESVDRNSPDQAFFLGPDEIKPTQTEVCAPKSPNDTIQKVASCFKSVIGRIYAERKITSILLIGTLAFVVGALIWKGVLACLFAVTVGLLVYATWRLLENPEPPFHHRFI